MLHLTGPHLWLLSPPTSLYHIYPLVSFLFIRAAACVTHISRHSVVLWWLSFGFSVLSSLCVALFLPFQSLSRRCLLTSSQITTQRRPWVRGPEYVCVCVCVCETCGYKCKSCVRSCMCLWVYLHTCVCVCVCVCVCPPCSCVLMHGRRRWIPPAAAIEGCCPLLFRTKNTN